MPLLQLMDCLNKITAFIPSPLFSFLLRIRRLVSSQVSSDQLNPPPSPPPTSGGSGKPWKYTVVGVVGGLVLASVIAAIVCYLFFAKQKQKTEPAVTSVSKETDNGAHDLLESKARIPQSTKVYTIEELKSATQDFSPDCLIKGSVYRRRINGDVAAIKKMSGRCFERNQDSGQTKPFQSDPPIRGLFQSGVLLFCL